jgi:hypothetical protein
MDPQLLDFPDAEEKAPEKEEVLLRRRRRLGVRVGAY